jgi:uncharacterized protein with NAD-binding domain and iron-sulfur cluster
MTIPSSETIVIVGGGVAGLTAAFELTKPGRFPGEGVVVYQMGWRLGGKCASARDGQGRLVEHGLHMWFGYYENAFRLLRDVYDEWARLPDRAAIDWRTAIKPQSFTPIGNGAKPPLALTWPHRPGEPGDGIPLSLLGSLVGVGELLGSVHDALDRAGALTSRGACFVPPAGAPIDESADELEIELRTGLDIGVTWLRSNGLDVGAPTELHRIGRYWNGLADKVQKHQASDADQMLGELYDVVAALVAGVISDVVVKGADVVDLDRNDFRQWLVLNGADHASVHKSPLIKALYDTMFQYPDGQTEFPSYGAGTAAQVLLRMLGTYCGAFAWKPQGSLGEILIAPLYEVLAARGVRFQFFHKLERIELADSGSAVAALHFARQVDVEGSTYVPTVSVGGRPCWPAAPKWKSIRYGETISKKAPDLESRWCDQRIAPVVLRQGVEFADAVLAIPLGAFKRFPRRNGPCDDLMRANPPFRALAERIALTPSLSVQVWCEPTLKELGWTMPPPTMVSGPPALQIWADMTQIVAAEAWGDAKPGSLHYFCNVLDFPPQGDKANAVRAVRKLAIDWFETRASTLWPGAVSGGAFNWTVLHASAEMKGRDRIDAQVLTANVDPSACCASSAAGMTQWRLKADGSSFEHLVLAGAWIDSGFNTECVESAVMSGMQASRALCGEPEAVFGEGFLHPGRAPLVQWILTGVAAALFD